MGKLLEILQGPDNKLSFSRIWGAVFGTIVIGAYVYAFFSSRPLPPETLYLLAIAMAPYVTTQGGQIIIKILELKGK